MHRTHQVPSYATTGAWLGLRHEQHWRRAGESGAGVQSVDRAAHILEILARRGTAGVSEVALDIGVHKSTAFRLLSALEERGLVEQTRDRGKYRLGLGILRLASTVPGRLDLVGQGRPVCEQLAAEFGETVNLAVLRSHHAVNLDQSRGSAAIAAHNWVGQLTPLHVHVQRQDPARAPVDRDP